MSNTTTTRFRLSAAQKGVLVNMADGCILHHDPRPPVKVWMYHPTKRYYRDLYYRTFDILLENELIHDPGVYFPIARFELTPKGKAIAAGRPAKKRKE